MKKSDSEDAVCAYCRFALAVSDTGDMLCSRKGVVPAEFSCRRFVYDPLKRVPKRLGKLCVPDMSALDGESLK